MEYGVVIPAWNAGRTIAQALDSVFAQSMQPAQVVVVDDGSTDDTASIAQSVSDLVQIVKQENQGPGAASSRGMGLLTTPLGAFLDADDIWLPSKMACQIDILVKMPDVDLVFSKMRQIRHGCADDGTAEERGGATRSTLTIRREVFLSVGDIIDPKGNRGDFVDWMARFREAGHREHEISEVLALRRIIPGSLSFGRDITKDKGYLEVAHRAILRARKRQSSTGNK